MDKQEALMLFTLTFFAVTILATVFLVKRASPEKRPLWLISCAIGTILLLGIYSGSVSIIASLVSLFFLKKEGDNPLKDALMIFPAIATSGLGVLFFALYGVLSVGGIYWFWLAIQLKSFGMFVMGIVPLTWIVTAPVGAYSLLFGTPKWVLNTFGS
ncbi:MAG: hypothetical protein ABL860_06585 [Candidatus Nitrotoga sp.]